MNAIRVLSGVACVSVFLATGAVAEILGVQPGTSANPKDNVPAEIQRSTPGGGSFSPGGTGPGTRGDALVGEEKEKPDPVTQRELEQNAGKNPGGAAVAAEVLKEQSKTTSKKSMKSKHRETSGSRDGSKTDREMFRQQRSDKAEQGQGLVNEQPMEKQQPANR